MTWTEDARLVPPARTGVLAIVALLVTTPARAAWLLVPLLMAATYAVDRWRVARARPLATAQSAAAFRWLLARGMVPQAADGREPEAAAPPIPASGVSIEREGDVWRVAYAGTAIRLRHSRGLALLAHLIRNPGQEIHVSQLDAITPGGSAAARNASSPDGEPIVAMSGDAGEILDARAREEYRRRIAELRADLEDAGAHADLGHAEAVRAELERIEDELRLAVGAGGRPRRAMADTERLRSAISHRIRAAIAQMARRHPALGAHLTASVSTGYRCIYEPVERSVDGRIPQPKV